jgi:hypothetical protein
VSRRWRRDPTDGQPPPPLFSFLLIITGIIAGLLLSAGYTTWSIDGHSHQACSELRILAVSRGAATAYDRAVKREYQRLYKLRCT